MLVEFSTRAGGSFTMFERDAANVLSAAGKSADEERGVITFDDNAPVLASLLLIDDTPPAEDVDGQPIVSLAQRARPLIEMLERARNARVDVIWGPA